MRVQTLVILSAITAISITAFSLIGSDKPLKKSDIEYQSKTSAEFTKPFEVPLINIPEEEFLLAIESRFIQTVTKKELLDQSSIEPFLGEDELRSIVSYNSVEITVFKENNEKRPSAIGTSEKLNEKQLALIRSLDYSANIYIKADFHRKVEGSDELISGYSTPHITIIPETQAEYIQGIGSLTSYLRDNSYRQTRMTNKSELDPGKIYFTVSKNGIISDVRLSSSCGYPLVDNKLVDLIRKSPGLWNPAMNEDGEAVDQELVLFFGNMGC
ncbi:MAG: hypothetical protein HKN45_10835 [Flavobacteriales bacterium]|nr:hypothetical protein [Flavobacteriales bacterium]NNK81259.1 hypothetical protein [Flavobacteriales bacterium]